MAKQSREFAQTMRIEIDDNQAKKIRENGSTVRILSPDEVAGSTSFHQVPKRPVPSNEDSDYHQLLQSIYDAVLITDAEGHVTEFNHRALAFFRYEPDHLLKAKLPDLISGADGTVIGAIRKNLMDHRYTLIEGTCRRRDGSLFPSEIAVNRLDRDMEGRLCFFVRDISVRKRAQDALEEAINKLEQHDRNRSQFISNVSHELRTPLTSMLYAITNMLKGVVGPMNDSAVRYLEMLLGDCRRLLTTVNDILDLRKIENKTLTLTKTRLPFGRLIRNSAESLAVQVEQKGLKYEIDTGNRLWFVNCDAQKIERVVLNLIGNALKFTSEGGVLRVRVEDDPDRENHVRVVVDDDGIGIPEADLSRVTERYYTVGDQPSGSGLGLAISKEVVTMHEGELQVVSPVPGKKLGTRIWFSLPTVEAPSVLVLEPEDRYREALVEQVREQGYRILDVPLYLPITDFLESVRPDMVIMDMDMGGEVEGSELVISMKSDRVFSRLPILALSRVPLPRSKEDLLRNFGVPLMGIPWNESELLDSITNAFLGGMSFGNQ